MEKTSSEETYVKWSQFITFSIALLAIVIPTLIWGINSVVANDRLRASEDKEIRCEVDGLKQGFNDKAELILVKITRLETIISNKLL